MPSLVYSTTCSVKDDRYRLSIVVVGGDENSSNIDSASFTATDIPINQIRPAMTQVNFEYINQDKRSTTLLPKSLMLNHILKVQQSQVIWKNNRKKISASMDAINDWNVSTPVLDQGQQASQTTLNTVVSETDTPQIPPQRSFVRFFSTQSIVNNETITKTKSSIILSYVDVSNSIRWNVKRLQLEFETEALASELYANLTLCLSRLTQRPTRLLVFVNPLCGKGRARFVFEKKVLSIFHEANITVDYIYTERANHAQDYVIHEDLSAYDGLVCVGGDGMFAELCHGLLLRTASEAQLNIDDPRVNVVRPDLRIGIIPAGSTDAVVFGTTGFNDPVTSALQIIVGESLSIDIATVHNEKGFVRFMATMLAYGFFGDIIQQSDKWRFLGPFRYDLAGFCQFIRNKSYHSDVTITLSPDASSPVDQFPTLPPMSNTDAKATSSVTPTSSPCTSHVSSSASEENSNDPALLAQVSTVLPALVFCRRNCETCASGDQLDKEKARLPLQIKREGKFTTINCLNMPCRCAKSKFGMSPFVHLGNGTFDLMLVKRSWRSGFLRFLWQVANDGRSIEDLPNVERYQASEVHIRPIHQGPNKVGNWSCDGELISGQEIHIRVHRQALNLFASGIHFDKLEEYKPTPKKKTTKCCAGFRSRKHKIPAEH